MSSALTTAAPISSQRNRLVCLLLASLIVAIFFSHWLWLYIDNQLQPFNDGYIQKIFILAEGLSRADLLEIPRHIYWSTIGPRTFLYQVGGAISVLLFGYSVDAILVVNSLSLITMAVFTYLCARQIMPTSYALIAVLALLCTPLAIDHARLVRPHHVAATFLAIAVWVFLRNIERPTTAQIWQMSGVALAAFLVHPSSVYVLAPVFVFFVLRNLWVWPGTANHLPSLNRVHLLPIIISFGSVAALCCVWIYLKLDQLRGMMQVIDEVFVPLYSGFDIFYRMPERVGLLNFALFGYFFLLLISAAIRSALTPKQLWVYLLTAACFMSFNVLHPTKEWANFQSVAPLIGLSSGFALSKVGALSRHRFPMQLIIFSCVSVWLLQYAHEGFGARIPGFDPCFEKPDSRICNINNKRSKAPLAGDWQLQPIFAEVLQNPRCNQQCSLVLVSQRPHYFSDEALDYQLLQHFPQVSRLDDQHFYPLRKVRIRRLGAKSEAVTGLGNHDFSVLLLEKDHKPANTFVGRGASPLEHAAIRRIQSAPQHFKLRAELTLPNGQFVQLHEHL